jgi:hypothetical protein
LSSSAASDGPLDTKSLSDEELFKRLPMKVQDGVTSDKMINEEAANESRLISQEKQALDELWSRHRESVERNLRARVFAAGSTLCPVQEPDKDHFVKMCVDECYLAYLRRTGRDEYRNFAGFLFTVLMTVTLDVRKQLIGREKHPPELVDIDDVSALLVDQRKKPLQIVAAGELRDIVEEILAEHAKESLKNALSTRILRLRHMHELTWGEIVDDLLPKSDARSRGAKIKVVRDLEKPDVMDCLRRLKERQIADARAFEV